MLGLVVASRGCLLVGERDWFWWRRRWRWLWVVALALWVGRFENGSRMAGRSVGVVGGVIGRLAAGLDGLDKCDWWTVVCCVLTRSRELFFFPRPFPRLRRLYPHCRNP